MARIRHEEPTFGYAHRVTGAELKGMSVRSPYSSQRRKKNGHVISPGRTVAATVLATTLASGAATTAEALGHELPDVVPIVNHVPFDTRHVAIENGDEQQENLDIIANIPTGSQPEGIDTYSFPIDLSDAQLYEPTETHEIIEPIAIGTINRLEAGMSLAETRNALNEALEANDIDINVDSLIANADQIVLDSEQKAQLQSIADELGYSDVQTLIADYGAGAIRESDPNRAVLDELLQTNNNTTIDMKLETAEHGDMLATIYITDEGYTIVANQYEHSEDRGVLLSLVIIPVVVPLTRRRTRDEQITHDYNKDEKAKSKAYKKYKKARDKELQKYIQEEEQRRKEALEAYEAELAKLRADITASLADAKNRPASAISKAAKEQIGSSSMFVSNVNLIGHASGGVGTSGGGRVSAALEEESEATAAEPAKKKTVVVAIPDAQTEGSAPVKAEPEEEAKKPLAPEKPAQPATLPIASEESTPDQAEEAKDEKEKTERKRRPFPRRIAKLIVISSLVAELLSGDSADPNRGHGVPEGAETTQVGKELGKIRDDHQEEGESENGTGTGTNGTGEGDGGIVVERTPDTGALILTYRDGELTGATLTGDVQNDLLITERQIPPEEPPIEEIRTHYNWVIPPNGTGEGLMNMLGVDPARWYDIGPALLANFPNVFYGDPNAPRIANPGELPDPVKDYLINVLGLE